VGDDRGYVDDGATGTAVSHDLRDSAGAVEDTTQIYIDHALPVPRRKFEERQQLPDARIIHQCYRTTELGDSLHRCVSHAVGIRDVRVHRQSTATGVLDLGQDRRHSAAINVPQRHRVTARGEQLCDTGPDSRTGASHHGNALTIRWVHSLNAPSDTANQFLSFIRKRQ
jgi:hypothetical protein